MQIDPNDKEAIAAALEKGRHLFAQSCDFTWGADKQGGLPPEGLPEVAFAGRSNVGKSSLINALTNRHQLARISHTPGRTQQLNFFNLGGKLGLVDLPGYGFAAVAKQKVAGWQDLIQTYLKGRVMLRRACILVDSRHGFKETDHAVMKILDEAAVLYQIVLTKGDEPRREDLAALQEKIALEIKKHPAAFPEVMVTSSRTGQGIPELRASLAALSL